MKNAFAVIMAGGVGSRFWPESRQKTPKQLLDITGSGLTMIAATVERLEPNIPAERVIVVTGEVTRQAVAEALPGLPEENILAEPVGRNTAACIGWAALHARRRDRLAVLAVMPADHIVGDKRAFSGSVETALKLAQKGELVTFGIAPDRPETGFGYIEMAEEVERGVRKVARFVEKPDLATAERYLAAGSFVWNSGMFFFTADRIVDEIAAKIPELKSGLDEIDAGIDLKKENEAVQRVYPRLASISIDYGVMEKAEHILCVPVDFGWSDIGSWSAAYDLSKKDENANAIEADAVVIGAKRNMARAPRKKLVALVGVEDLVVVDTPDSLLVCKRDRAQDVKDVVEELKRRGRTDLL